MSQLAASSSSSKSRIWTFKKNTCFMVPAAVIKKGCLIKNNKVEDYVAANRTSRLSTEVKNEFCRLFKIVIPLRSRTVQQADSYKLIMQCSIHEKAQVNATIFLDDINLDAETKCFIWSSETSILCNCLIRNPILSQMIERIEAGEVKNNKPVHQAIPAIPEADESHDTSHNPLNDDANQANAALIAMDSKMKAHEKQLEDLDLGYRHLIKAISSIDSLPEQEKQFFLEQSHNRRRLSAISFRSNTFAGQGCSHWNMTQNQENPLNEGDEEGTSDDSQQIHGAKNNKRGTFTIDELSSSEESEQENGNHADEDQSEMSDDSHIGAAKEAKIHQLRAIATRLRNKRKGKFNMKQLNRDLTAKVRNLTAQLQAKALEVELREEEVEELREMIGQKDEMIEENEAVIVVKNAQITNLQQVLEAKEEQIGEKNILIREKDDALAAKEREMEDLKKSNIELAQKFFADITERNG